MAKSLRAIYWGEDYQARHFWMSACDLFFPETRVVRVSMELDNVKSLDDVGVLFDPPLRDEWGDPLTAEYHQVKFHVTASGACTWRGFMDPAFINAESISLLQRLRNAQLEYAAGGKGSRFVLFSPWSVHPDDLLAELYMQRHGGIDWARLSQGTEKRSKWGKIRREWKDHLGIASDEDLWSVLRPLRIVQGPPLDQLGTYLNWKLRSAGLRPVPEDHPFHPYDDLYRKLVERDRRQFTRGDIEELCKEADLWVGPARPIARKLGIRSFLRGAERLGEDTDSLLCLLEFFEDRHIKCPALWPEIGATIEAFLADAPMPGREHHLFLDAHSSIAFAAGYFLDTKSGVDVAPMQSGAGREIWHPSRGLFEQGRYPNWVIADVPTRSTEGSDVAVAMGTSRDIETDVSSYVSACLPQVGRILSFTLPTGAGNRSVADGVHAKLLADEVSRRVQGRTQAERAGVLHIFPAAPNALVFFLGQESRGFRRCQLYEYDFDGARDGSYRPSLAFPPMMSIRMPASGRALATQPGR